MVHFSVYTYNVLAVKVWLRELADYVETTEPG
jgi:hypothetical protein